MFGETLDYYILRNVAYPRHRTTESELNDRANQVVPGAFEKAASKARILIERFEGSFPLDPTLRYLDMGCGTGELTIALSRLGINHITGVDFLPRNIERARACARQLGVGQNVQFLCQDLHTWRPESRYDVLLSFNAFEHIDDPRAFLERMTDFTTPAGVAVIAFGPLFHSPFGDHMWGFFRLQIPWRGVLFSEKAVLRLRREYFRPTDPADRYHNIAGGLNLMRYSEFVDYVHATGWQFDHLAVNTFLRRLPPLRFLSNSLMRIPSFRDYFPHNVYAVVRRRRKDRGATS